MNNSPTRKNASLPPSSVCRSAWAAALVFTLLAPATFAANWAWDTAPGGANFSGSYWTSGTTPGSGTGTPASGDSLYFGTSSQTSLNNDDTGFTFGGITFNSGASAFTIAGYAFTLNGTIANSSSSAQIINNNITLNANESVNATSGNLTLGGIISDGGHNYVLTAAGGTSDTLTLSGVNTYGGGTTMTSGKLSINSASALGSGNITMAGGASSPTLQVSAALTLSSGITITVGNSGHATVIAGFVNPTASTTFEIDSKITGSSGNVKSGSNTGTVRFANDTSDYATFQMGYGITEFTSVANAGTASALGSGSGGGLGNTTYVIGNGGSSATFRYVGTGNDSTTRQIDWQGTGGGLSLDASGTGSGTVQYLSTGNLRSTGSGAATLTLTGSNTGNNTLAQVVNNSAVSGNTSLTKSGTGTWILTGANTYSGATTVNGGTLLVNSPGSLASASAVTVNSGGTNGGTGTINGAVTYSAGSAAEFTVTSASGGANTTPLTFGSTLAIATSGTIPVACLNLPTGLPAGTYTLANYTSSGSSGAFNTTPVILSGSLASGNTASVSTSSGVVSLTVTAPAPTGGTWTNRDGAYVVYARDALGDVLSRTMPGGLSWNATYLSDGRIATEHETGGSLTARSMTYAYYSAGSPYAGRLQTVTDGRSTSKTYSYDDYLRLSSLATTGSAPEQQTSATYQYDRRNLLTNLVQSFNSTNTGPATVLSRKFDTYGQLISESVSVAGGGLSGISQTWDAAGRRTMLNFGPQNYGFRYQADGLMTAADGSSFGYGDNGLLTSRTNNYRTYFVTQRDGAGRVLQTQTKVFLSTNLTETLSWRNDGRLSSYTALRDFTDARSYTYAPWSQRLIQEVFNVSGSQKFTNNYTFDNGQAGGLGVLTSIGTPAQSTNEWSAPASGGLDGLNRVAKEQTAILRRPATGLALGAATVSATLDGGPVNVQFDGTDAEGRWRAMVDMTPGSHTLRLAAQHPSGLYTAYATNTFNVIGGADTVTDAFDGEGNAATRVWLSSNGQTNRTQTMTWDAFDRLIKVSERDSVGSGQDWVGIYDGLGRKVRTITTLVVSNTPITSPSDAVSTVDSWFDPQVEFQEVGVVVNGGVFNMKTYGPDANGVHGGLQGVGGLERVTPFGHISGIGLLQDYFGNIIGSVTNAAYGVTWNPARFSSLGPVPGYEPTALTLNTTVAQSVGWRGKHLEAIGTFHWGARPYEPASGRFLAHDPVFDSANPSGFTVCGGDMVNGFDADARFGKPSSGPEAPFSEYLQNAQHEAFLDDLYGQRVTATDIIAGVINVGAGVLTLPVSMALGVGNDVDTAVSGTYINEYGLVQEASTGQRVWSGTMAAMNFLPIGDLAEGGFQTVRGLGEAVAGGLDVAEDFRYGVGGALDVAGDFGNAAEGGTTAFDSLMAQVRAADFSTPRNGAVFWTGYSQGNQAAAMSWAEVNGKFTVEMTQGGTWLKSLDLFGANSPVSGPQATALWNAASEQFASGASGSVNAFTRGTTFNPNSAFYNIELPILRGRRITYRGY